MCGPQEKRGTHFSSSERATLDRVSQRLTISPRPLAAPADGLGRVRGLKRDRFWCQMTGLPSTVIIGRGSLQPLGGNGTA